MAAAAVDKRLVADLSPYENSLVKITTVYYSIVLLTSTRGAGYVLVQLSLISLLP